VTGAAIWQDQAAHSRRRQAHADHGGCPFALGPPLRFIIALDNRVSDRLARFNRSVACDGFVLTETAPSAPPPHAGYHVAFVVEKLRSERLLK
jgi:hypothetical protein